jgi:hypothetical protein
MTASGGSPETRPLSDVTLRAVVCAVLSAEPDFRFCMPCLENAVPRINPLRALVDAIAEGHPIVFRQNGRCSLCNQVREVAFYDGPRKSRKG